MKTNTIASDIFDYRNFQDLERLAIEIKSESENEVIYVFDDGSSLTINK
jgi:hypothetical protein